MEPLDLKLDSGSDDPVYRQIANAIRREIESGRLGANERLPATRDLAARLGVNRNTVVAAYDRLVASGVVSSHTGRGTFVDPAFASKARERAIASPDPETERDPEPSPRERWDATFSRAVDGPGVERLLTVYKAVLTQDAISFAGSYPAPELMPVDGFRRTLDRVLREDPHGVLAYGPTGGHAGLREALAASMRRRASGVAASDILVTNGAQQAIDLTFRTLLDRGDTALVEDPTYTGALSVLGSIGARVVALPTDDDGIRPEALRDALARHRPRVLYVQPTFHNPTARVTSLARRREILALARAFGCPIVEDDWGGDLRFEGPELPTLHAMDRERRTVLYVSSFSKTLMPGLRLGWVAAPAPVLRRLVALKQVADCGSSPVLQAALARFIVDGDLRAHLGAVRGAYRARRDAMLESLAAHFPDEARWTVPQGGLFLWIALPEGFDTSELLVASRRAGVVFNRGDLFHADGGGVNTMRLSYASVDPERIDEGIRILADLVRARWEERGRGSQGVVETMPVL